MMSLPTPPGTSHREKENRFSTSGSRVVWSQHNQYHCITSLPHVPAPTRVSKELPTKSILKKRPQVLLPIPDNKQREITPQPSDPLVDLKYLEHPVSKIVASDASLRDLIEAYSVLAARIKTCVSRLTDADASWPLFQPLRKHRDTIIDAFIRDLGRALVDPASDRPEDVEEEKVLLPSPKLSPRKKKGMTAEQAKYARDLCTTCHSVVKLLAVVFTLPAVHQVFSDKQLCAVLSQVLAIPLADELPTPNARKTCALAIWLLQVQRLPSEVLVPSRDRIAYALRRGMEGELGKEGKKGSASDGLKAIHDLSLYQPATFVPAFTEILPSILANLLATTLNRRSQACHALGGFALACTSLPPSYIHTRISSSVAAFITETTPKSPSKKSPPKKSPMASADAPIVRTMRTTLVVNDPQHVAQGPVWSLSVLAHFIALLGNVVSTDVKINRVISTLLTVSMQHKKPAVKGIALLVWRVATWAYFQPPLLVNSDEELDVELDGNSAREKDAANVRKDYWNFVSSVVGMGVGTGTITALLNTDLHEDDYLERVFSVLKTMTDKGGEVCSHAMQIVKHFVSFEAADTDWNINKLLPPILFSSNPSLLDTEFKSLAGVLRPVFGHFPELEDVRSLTREEVTKDSVFTALVRIWKEGLACIELPDHAVIPSELMEIWTGLLTALKLCADTADSEETSEYAVPAAVILVDILQDANLDLTPRVEPNHLPTSPVDGATTPTVTQPATPTNASLKLKVVRDLWSTTRTVIPHEDLGNAGEKLLSCLVQNEHEFTDPGKDARIEWTSLCAELLVLCDVDELKAFWGYNVSPDIKKLGRNWTSDVRSLIWKRFVEKWKEDEKGNWEGGVILLGVPFADENTWALSNDEFSTWEDFLCHTMNKALDYGVDSIAVLDAIAELVSQNQNPTFTSFTRVADLLMSHLDMPDARQIPDAVMEFVNDTLRYSYPPEPRNKVTSMWVIRSLTRVIETCPSELAMNLLETVQDGLCTWISDEYQALTQEEYTFDILPLYETTLLSIRALPRTIETLERVSPILESAFGGRPDKPAPASEAFTDFWQFTYATMPVPHSGWPTKIQCCLGLLTGANVEDDIFDNTCYDADTSVDDSGEADSSFELNSEEPQIVHLESDELHEPANHSICATERPGDSLIFDHPDYATLPRAAIKEIVEAESDAEPHPDLTIMSDPPSTPIACSSRASTPPRPHKPSVPFPFFPLHSPASPIPVPQRTPTTPKRTPLAGYGNISGGSCSSSNKRRRIENKENESPRSVITPVVERLAIKLPEWISSRAPGKRRLLDESEEDRPSKKSKPTPEPFLAAINSDSEDEWTVASLLVPLNQKPLITDHANSGVTTHRVSTYPSLFPNKRKGVFMDAVELPTLREIYGTLTPSSSRFSTPLSHRTLAPSMKSSGDPDTVTFKKHGHGSGWKRRRNNDTFKSKLMGDPFSSSPLQVLGSVLPDSEDSSTLMTSPLRGSSELSSDDDPHLGQVTPHHLISPALRRVRTMTDDPPSDDSDMSASPSRDIVSRRIQRSESLRASGLKPILSS